MANYGKPLRHYEPIGDLSVEAHMPQRPKAIPITWLINEPEPTVSREILIEMFPRSDLSPDQLVQLHEEAMRLARLLVQQYVRDNFKSE